MAEWSPAAGRRQKWGVIPGGFGVSFSKMISFRGLDRVSKPCEATESHQIVHLLNGEFYDM